MERNLSNVSKPSFFRGIDDLIEVLGCGHFFVYMWTSKTEYV